MKRAPKRKARKRRTLKQKLRARDRLVHDIERQLASPTKWVKRVDMASASEASYTSYARTALTRGNSDNSGPIVKILPPVFMFISLHTKPP